MEYVRRVGRRKLRTVNRRKYEGSVCGEDKFVLRIRKASQDLHCETS